MKNKLVVLSGKSNSNDNEQNTCVSGDLFNLDPREYSMVEFKTFDEKCYIFANKCKYFEVPIDLDKADIETVKEKTMRAIITNEDVILSNTFAKYMFSRLRINIFK